MCKTQPQLRLQGIRHLQRSTKALAANSDNGSIPLEAALAARLALAFTESWYTQKPSTGIEHINFAKTLVRRAISKHQTSSLAASELSRLSFFANTWMYQDVIARFTSTNKGTLTDPDLITACSVLSSIPPEQQIDPLMGCAITLFPLIGQLADLVGHVRRRSKNRNSPAIISKATELRIAIERWVPPIDLDSSDHLNSNVCDAIQTAEAYRWSTLLLLRQTVPELPWRHSMWELAQKVLTFLATVSITSQTRIVQIFPLIVAGCEAVEEEDREFVYERWKLMARSMITGIVDRCREVTTEVWRRRDEYQANQRVSHTIAAQRLASPTTSPRDSIAMDSLTGQDTSNTSQDGLDPAPVNENTWFRGSTEAQTEFPESVSFKKGIDPITRAGHMNYTVKGDLHWLGVMKDWNWEGKSLLLMNIVDKYVYHY